MDSTVAPRKTVRIGVYLPSGSQLLDLACVDIFGTISYEYLSNLGDLSPPPIVNLAPSIKIFYIGTVQPGEPIELTSQMHMVCTHHMSDPEVQPGKLDVVLVPGPDPRLSWDKAVTDWLTAHAASKETDILSVCTGIFVCAAAGLVQGKKVCGPRGLQKQLKAKYEAEAWLGDEYRWIKDGNFWSSGGVTNGNDLVSAYVREGPHFPGPVAEFGLALTDTGDRPQRYGTGQTTFMVGMVWQVIKAAIMGLGRKTKTA